MALYKLNLELVKQCIQAKLVESQEEGYQQLEETLQLLEAISKKI